MVGEDIIEAICKRTSRQLMAVQFNDVEKYFLSKEKSSLYYEGFTRPVFNILFEIKNYSKEKLHVIQEVFTHFSKKSEKVILPLLMLNIGVDYLKNGNDQALYNLSKKERQVFENQVLLKRKFKKN
ncbi:MAG: hypothetical protein ACJATI_000273 [Halioglobus sp.]|jgi:hypothetical protein